MVKKIFIVIGILILGFIVKDTILKSYYAYIIHLNWSIDIPKSYEEIYSTESEASFLGDGERYHVFQYTKSKAILKSLNWTSSKNTDMESEVAEILEYVDIPKEYMPDFQSDYQYYTTMEDDSSRIYFIFVANTKKLYIIESFF